MTGIGEHLEDVVLPRDLFAVLVNPLVNVPAEQDCAGFRAPRSRRSIEGGPAKDAPAFLDTSSDVVVYAAARGNDLEAPAKKLFPVIDTLLSELRSLDGSSLAQLSGAGPTCFALFDNG